MFSSLDVNLESSRLGVAVAEFSARVAALRSELAAVQGLPMDQVLADLDRAQQAVGKMRSTSMQIIHGVGQDEFRQTARDVTSLNNSHLALTASLVSMRADLRDIQAGLFDRQERDVAGLQRVEYLIAGFFLTMVLGATVYGSRLRKEFDRRDDEREHHVRQLEQTQAELREVRDILEERVIGRTLELAQANQALRGEIDERRRAEGELRISEERYALAAYSANDGLWDWDLQGDQFYYSPRWRALLGYADDEMVDGANAWLDRVHPDDRAELDASIAAHLADTSRPLEIEHRVVHRDGAYRWMLVRATAVLDDQGEPTRMVGSHSDVTARKNAELQLLHDALHDMLTGLPNRALLIDRLEVALRSTRGQGDPQFAVLFIDLDRFKVVNDSLGHVIGDELLVEVGRRLASVVRPGDVVARLGGDEFTILVERLTTERDAEVIAGRVLTALVEPIRLNGYDVRASASIGIAIGSSAYDTPTELLRDADTAMYRAKADGRGQYRVFESSMYDTALDALVLETDLRIAVERQQLSLRYQPILSMEDGVIVGLEALARWHHPTRGPISPATFIAIAEESGAIVSMGRWVLGEACRQLSTWKRLLPTGRPLYVSVNVSPRELWQEDFLDQVFDALRLHGLGPDNLRLEITESSIMRNREQTIIAMRRLSDLGVGISIDDFGTGYSTLSYIKDLPVDTLKIDRTFIAELASGGKNAQLVRTILELGHHLQLSVVAEGIETAEQERMLMELSCRFGQGYHYFEPLTPGEVEAMMLSGAQPTKTTG